MNFDEILEQVLELVRRQGRVSYRTIQRRFEVDDKDLEDLKEEILFAHLNIIDEEGRGLVWTDESAPTGVRTAPSNSSGIAPLQAASVAFHPPGAERRQLTVMFCDLVGSTALSGQLDPEDLRHVVRAYQQTSAEVIQDFDGHIAQYLGDGLLVYFGWPQAHEDDAQRAVRTGLGMLAAMDRLNTRLEREKGIRLAIRVGIHTGLVVVGEMGGGGHHELLALGKTPNIASRIQGVAMPETVVISADTHRLVQGYFTTEPLGPKSLKGLAAPVRVYRILGQTPAESRFEAATVTAGLTPLVGRDEEIGLVRQRWAQAKGGEGQVVLLSGEPGIGKSRMAHVLHEQIAKEPHTRLQYQCSPYYVNSALYPFIRQLERAARLAREDTNAEKLDKLEALLAQATARLVQVVPLIAALVSLPTDERYAPLTMSPQKQKEETLSMMLEQLEGLASQQPVLLVFEDAHWIDPTSQELLDLIVERAHRIRVLVLITYRPKYSPPWSGQAHVTVLVLNRLTHKQSAVMIGELSAGKGLPAEVFDQIVTKTDGIPLFVEELTKTVLTSKRLRAKTDRNVLSSSLPPLAIPTTLHDSLMARLDELASVKEVAQVGAVIGREFSYELLASVCTLSEDELDEALERLSRSGLIFRRGVPPDARYLFKHALVQDAAYESLLKSRRQQLHARISQILEDRFPDLTGVEPELLAHHFSEAGLAEQALVYWHRAGERAVARSAHVEAIGHLRKGLVMLQDLPNSPKQAQHELILRIELGPPLIATKGYGAPEVQGEYTRARELWQKVGDNAQICPILYGLWTFYTTRAEYETARTLCRDLLKAAENAQDVASLLDAHVALTCTSFLLGEFDLAREHGERGMSLYDPPRHSSHALQNPGVVCGTINAVALWYLGYPDQARRRSDEMLNLTRELSHPFSLAVALTWLAMLHQCRRNAWEARALAEEAMGISSEHSFPNWLWVAAMVRGWALVEQGLQEEGRNQVRECAALAEATGARIWGPYRRALLAEAYKRAGQTDAAKQSLAEALTVAKKYGERYWEAELYRFKGELLLLGSTNDLTSAETCLKQAIEVARKQQAKSLELRAATSLARLWCDQGKHQEACDLLAPVYSWFTEGFDTVDLQEAKLLLDKLDGG